MSRAWKEEEVKILLDCNLRKILEQGEIPTLQACRNFEHLFYNKSAQQIRDKCRTVVRNLK